MFLSISKIFKVQEDEFILDMKKLEEKNIKDEIERDIIRKENFGKAINQIKNWRMISYSNIANHYISKYMLCKESEKIYQNHRNFESKMPSLRASYASFCILMLICFYDIMFVPQIAKKFYFTSSTHYIYLFLILAFFLSIFGISVYSITKIANNENMLRNRMTKIRPFEDAFIYDKDLSSNIVLNVNFMSRRSAYRLLLFLLNFVFLLWCLFFPFIKLDIKNTLYMFLVIGLFLLLNMLTFVNKKQVLSELVSHSIQSKKFHVYLELYKQHYLSISRVY